MKVVLVGGLQEKAIEALSSRGIKIVKVVSSLSNVSSWDEDLGIDKVVILKNGLSSNQNLEEQITDIMSKRAANTKICFVVGEGLDLTGVGSFVEDSKGWLSVDTKLTMSLLVDICTSPNPSLDEEVAVGLEEEELDLLSEVGDAGELELYNREDVKVILVTGSRPGSGVSTVVNNLSVLLGRRGVVCVTLEANNGYEDLERFTEGMKPATNSPVLKGLVKEDNTYWLPSWDLNKVGVNQLTFGEIVLIDIGYDPEKLAKLGPHCDEVWIVSEPSKKSRIEIENLMKVFGEELPTIRVVWNKVNPYTMTFAEGVGDEGTFSVPMIEPSLASKADWQGTFLVNLPEATSEVLLAFETLLVDVAV